MTAPTVQETAPLLQQHSSTSNRDACHQADQTTWRIELRFLTSNSIFLVLASLLYYSIAITSIVLAGRLGSLELGAVSLANVTANVTGIVIFQGLATTLDTLCAQAYGSGNLSLVGLNVQRMTFLLWCITIPVAILWLNATTLLKYVIPDEEVASLAGQYLKVLIFGAPGVALFESVKRYLQVQGHFAAILVVLAITATSNFLLTWFLVTVSGISTCGAPSAGADYLMRAETVFGVHRHPYCSCHNLHPPSGPANRVCHFLHRSRMLARVQQCSLSKLDANAEAGPARSLHD